MEEKIEYYFKGIKELGEIVLKELYSPMFDKKIIELTDEELRTQIRLWVEEELK